LAAEAGPTGLVTGRTPVDITFAERIAASAVAFVCGIAIAGGLITALALL
jgi:hypothetical protein